MKYLCPTVLQGMLAKQQAKINAVKNEFAKQQGETMSGDEAERLRAKKSEAVSELKAMMEEQMPLKWIDRVIMWCADKMPSFTGEVSGDATAMVEAAIAKDTLSKEVADSRKK